MGLPPRLSHAPLLLGRPPRELLPAVLRPLPLAALVCEHCEPLDDSLPGRRLSSSASLVLLLLTRREPHDPRPSPADSDAPGGVPELGVAGVAGVGGGVAVDEGGRALPSPRPLETLGVAPSPSGPCDLQRKSMSRYNACRLMETQQMRERKLDHFAIPVIKGRISFITAVIISYGRASKLSFDHGAPVLV